MLTNAYLCFNNLIPALFVSLWNVKNYLYVFFILIFFLHCFGIYEAKRRIEWSTNAIILNSYYLIFHVGFMLMWISKVFITDAENKYLSNFIYQMSGLVCLIVLILSVIHEFLTLLCEFICSLMNVISDLFLVKNNKRK